MCNMDNKDKAIIWILYIILAFVLHLNLYALIIGAVIVGIAVKTIEANFTQIIDFLQSIQTRRQ